MNLQELLKKATPRPWSLSDWANPANIRLGRHTVNNFEGLLETNKDAVERLDKIAALLNGELTPERQYEAYSLAYSGKQRKAIRLAEVVQHRR